MALTAAEHGAAVVNHAEAVDVLRGDPVQPLRVTGVRVRDRLSSTGASFDVHAKAVVFAGGPFTDALRTLEDAAAAPAVRGAAGTHIVLPGYFSSVGMGLLDIATSDGRFLFLLPWQGHTIVGTTDRKGEPTSTPAPPEAEILWLLQEVQKYLKPNLQVRRSDVLSAWQGWRPLAVDPHAAPGAPASRDHVISVHPHAQTTFVTGGKWTTYREMAEDVVDRVVADKRLAGAGPCRTKDIVLHGGHGFSPSLYIQLIHQYAVTEPTARHLAQTYGTLARHVLDLGNAAANAIANATANTTANTTATANATVAATPLRKPVGPTLVEGHPHLECEVTYAATAEMAQTVRDVLSLRTRLAFVDSEAAKRAAPRATQLMADALGWTDEEASEQLTDALAHLAEFGGPFPKEGEPLRTHFPDLHELFDRLDRDHNGYIDAHEMENAAAALSADSADVGSKEELRQLFLRFSGAASANLKQVGAEHSDDEHSDAEHIDRAQFVEFWQQNLHRDEALQRIAKEFKATVGSLGKNSSGIIFG